MTLLSKARLVPAGRSARRSGLRAVPPALVLVAALSACSSGTPEAHAPHAGAYPIATPAAQVLATPSASDSHYALVSAGDPVDVTLPGAQVVALVSGPDVTVPSQRPGPPPSSAPGVLTVTVTSTSGVVDVPASSFLLLDEGRGTVPFRADAASVHVAPGAPGTLRLSAQIPAGHATLTWQPTGHPMVTWDFVVEID